MKKIILLLSVFCSLVLSACPVTLDPTYEACEGDTILLDSNGDPSYTYQWFLNGTLIPGADSPTLMVAQEGMYQVDATNGSTNCSDVTTVTLYTAPPDLGPFQLTLCDDELNGSNSTDEISTFDLTTQNDVVTGGDTTLTVSWYETPTDEMSNNPIADPTMYQNTSTPQTIIGRITSTEGCKTVIALTLTAYPNPAPNVSPIPLQVCDADNDGFGDFDLTTANADILNGEPDVSIGYYETFLDAQNGDPNNQLQIPYSNVVPFSQIVYARVTRDVPPNPLACFTIVELELQVLAIPNLPDITFQNPVIVFDINGDGVEEFNLTINEAAILGIQDPADFEPITYYVSEIDAMTQTNAIAVPTAFLSTGQTIFPLLQNLITGCFRISPFDIVVQGVPITIPPDDIFIDEGDLDGLAVFDLTVNEAQMLGPLDPTIHSFSYHITVSDANNGINEITNPTAYQNIANPQEIHVRLTNINNGAYALASFVIETDGVLGVETASVHSFSMFPNPSNEALFISSEISNELSVAIYETNGRLVLSKEFESATALDVSNLASGMYVVVVTSEGKQDVKQLIKN